MNDVQMAVDAIVAQEKLAEVEQLVGRLSAAEGMLEAGYAELAYLLRDVSEQRYWEGVFESFGEFLKHLSTKYNLGKSQLYNYLNTAKELGDDVTKGQLDDMGISKALVLRDAKRASGTIPQNVIDAAVDPKVSVKDIKKLLFDAGTITKPEDGSWRHLDDSCYMTDEEYQEILDAEKCARRIDPPISEGLAEHAQRKEVRLRMAREFLGTYAHLLE